MAGYLWGKKRVEDKKGYPHALKGNYVKMYNLIWFTCPLSSLDMATIQRSLNWQNQNINRYPHYKNGN